MGFEPKKFAKQLVDLMATVPQDASDFKSSRLKQVRSDIHDAAQRLGRLSLELDPIPQPDAMFDPSDPKMTGQLIARTLLDQGRHDLATVGKFYGSGVYALYYVGDFEPYRPISGTETPAYVGKADPARLDAVTPTEQDKGLSTRLGEHLKSIEKAENLEVRDFECRYLVVRSAWQNTAEDYLIEIFKPVWNKETEVCYGIGKHGDRATTRRNKRSTWDTIHPGRAWAGTSDAVANDKTAKEIIRDIAEHFERNPPVRELPKLL